MLRLVIALVSIGLVEWAALAGGWVSAAGGSEKEVVAAIARARVPFVENRGQVRSQKVAYLAETFAGRVIIEREGAVAYQISSADQGGVMIRERFGGEALSPTGIELSTVKVSYFRGRDPKAWQSGLSAFDAVSLGEISDGISLVVKAHNNNVEKVFTVAPGADPGAISVQVEGIDGLRVLPNGELELRAEPGPVSFSSPIAYQEIGGARHDVKVAYALHDGNAYGFTVGKYDRVQPLVIDPIIASTYIGYSDADYGRAVVVDLVGNVYVAGHSGASGSPSSYPTTPGSYTSTAVGSRDVVVSKFDPTLHSLLASTFVGGTGFDSATSMAIEIGIEPGESDHIVVAGLTTSTDFPIPAPPYDAFDSEHNGSSDVFVLRLSGDLSTLEASTLVGGSHMENAFEPNTDRGPDLAIDTAGNIYVAGTTYSSDFPVIPAGKCLGCIPYQDAKHGDDDAFVIKLRNDLTDLLGWTYLGGGNEDRGTSVAVGFFDDLWHVFVSGHTESAEDWLPPPYEQFPITSFAFDPTHNSRGGAVLEDGFVSRFDANLSTLEASTFIGGDREDLVWDMAVDRRGWVYIAGRTGSLNFPTTPAAFMPERYAAKNGFVAKLDSGLSMLAASTHLGGIPTDDHPTAYAETSLYGIALDDFETVWVTGYTYDSYQPTFPVIGLIQYRPWYDPIYYKYKDVILTGFDPSLQRLQTSLHVSGADNQQAWSIFTRSVRSAPPEENYVEVTVAGWSEDGSYSDRFYPVFYNDTGFVDSYDYFADNDDILVTTFRIFILPIFIDGFESGDTIRWSSTVP